MKKAYALARLLEHGPLTMGEILEITRWKRKVAEWATREVRAAGVVVADKPCDRRAIYRLAR